VSAVAGIVGSTSLRSDSPTPILDGMLELRPVCENCASALPPEATDAMICTFECTFCRACVDGVLGGVCPNCGGGFAPRPIRPAALLDVYPPTTEVVHKPIDAR
jgi:hypothetical protein